MKIVDRESQVPKTKTDCNMKVGQASNTDIPTVNRQNRSKEFNTSKKKLYSGKQNSMEDEKTKLQEGLCFKYQDFDFQFISEKRIKCPKCKCDFKNILNHIRKSSCSFPDFEDISKLFKQFTKENLDHVTKDEH